MSIQFISIYRQGSKLLCDGDRGLSVLLICRMLLATGRPKMGATLPSTEIPAAQIAVPAAASPAGQQVEVAALDVPLPTLAT